MSTEENYDAYIKPLRERVEDLDPNLTDFDLLRWLQGYNGDIENIVPKLRDHLKLMNSWDYVNYQRNPIVYKHWPYGLLGCTGVDNNLLYVKCLGLLDGDGLLKSVSITEFMRTRVYDMETIMSAVREQERKTGKQCKIVYLVDLEHMKYDSMLISLIKGRFKNFHDYFTSHYVEVFDKFILVNVPSFGYYIFQALNSVMPEKTRKKLIVLGPEWKTDITEHVTKEALPVHWGGTLTDKDGDVMYRSKIVVPPGKVSEKYYWTPDRAKYSPDEMSLLQVPAGSFEYITVQVTKPGTKLEWYFTTDDCWHFCAYFSEDESKRDSDKMEIVFPSFGLAQFATIVPENDVIVCKKPGFYRLKFDNRKSWFTTLNINYKIIIHD